MPKIECLIQRPNGSNVTLGDATYSFTPDRQGRHVADIEDEDHVARLLSIPEGYRLVRTSAPRANKGRNAAADTGAQQEGGEGEEQTEQPTDEEGADQNGLDLTPAPGTPENA